MFGRTVNKQIFEGLTTGLLQTTATVVDLLDLSALEAGKSSSWICSPDIKIKAIENFTTRAQDLIRLVCVSYSYLYKELCANSALFLFVNTVFGFLPDTVEYLLFAIETQLSTSLPAFLSEAGRRVVF